MKTIRYNINRPVHSELKEGAAMTRLLLRLFVKDHGNTSDASVREAYGKLSGITGIAVNLLLFFIKITAGVLAGSISIIADAFNNLSDSGSAIVTLIGFKISGKPADAGHPYGHARMEYVSGLIVSIAVMFVGLELFLNSVRKILEPEGLLLSWLVVFILAISMLLKLWLCLFYRKLGRAIGSETVSAAAVDSRNDILATSAVLAALLVSGLTRYNIDGWMGAAVAVFITVSGIRLIKDTVSPLLGMAPSREMVDRIYKKIMSYDGIVGLHDLTVHNYGVDKYFASVHCEVSADQDIMVSHDIIDNIERDFLKDLGIHLVIHLDPVITDDERINKLKSNVESLVKDISPEISIHDFRVFFGITHSKLIFDIVVPYGFKYGDDELVRILSEKIMEMDKSYRSVITVDHHYVPDFQDK
jgi:cation diffusion facilitator family transporter